MGRGWKGLKWRAVVRVARVIGGRGDAVPVLVYMGRGRF